MHDERDAQPITSIEGESTGTPGELGTYSRQQVRSLIFHLLYAMEGFDYQAALDTIIDNLNKGYDQHIEPDGEIAIAAREIIARREHLDEIIQKFLQNWRLERVGTCTHLILRLGVWELLSTDLPASIVINEAVELAKCFAEKDAYKFVNGVLDQIDEQRVELKKTIV